MHPIIGMPLGTSIVINTKMCITGCSAMKKDEISTDLASTTCQFCGASFSRGTELSLHYKEKHPDDIGKEQ